MNNAEVQVTADALTSLRTTSPLAVELGLDCPYDHLFANDAGKQLAAMALSLDPVYEQYNIVRYKWFTERLDDAAGRFDQFLILGAGFDTRALTRPAFASGTCQIFEVDFPDTLAQKQAVMAAAGIETPNHLHFVPADLVGGAQTTALVAAGYRPDTPTAMFMEGVSFFLARDAAEILIDPKTLDLAPRSRMVFDCWTRSRADSLNASLVAKTGRRLFGDSPFGDSAADIRRVLQRDGSGDTTVMSLGAVSDSYGVNTVADPLGESWFVVDAWLP